MKHVLFSLVITFLLSGCDLFQVSAPTDVLLFEQKKVSSILAKERKLGADTAFVVGSPSRYICPETTNCQELTSYFRGIKEGEKELPLITKYYFGKDSIVNFIQYEWTRTVPGITVEERERRMVVESKRFDVYVAKLNEVANQLRWEMGEPIANDGEIKKDKTSLLDIYKYNISFEKDGKHVDVKLIWSPKRGARFFKVWSKVYWLN